MTRETTGEVPSIHLKDTRYAGCRLNGGLKVYSKFLRRRKKDERVRKKYGETFLVEGVERKLRVLWRTQGTETNYCNVCKEH